MPSLLARNADFLVTMDGDRRELAGGSLYAEDGIIRAVGPAAELPQTADTVLDMSGQIVLPGFVNCHHHLNQTLTRALPAAQDNNLPHLALPAGFCGIDGWPGGSAGLCALQSTSDSSSLIVGRRHGRGGAGVFSAATAASASHHCTSPQSRRATRRQASRVN